MIAKVRYNMEMLNLQKNEFPGTPADKIPLSDESVDIVIANGIYNLSPGKTAIIHEAYRVLRPRGRHIFAEIILEAPLPEEIRKNVNDWFRCIDGALPKDDFLKYLQPVGFSNSKILWLGRSARTGHELSLCAVIRTEKKE